MTAGGPPVLSRPRLDERALETARRRLTLVTAPPGLGKTVLLRGWAGRLNVAWYDVGAGDGDAAALARGLLGAAGQQAAGVDRAAVDRSAPGSLAADQLMVALGEGLADDLVLVLDDVQELGASQPAWDLLADLVRAGPARLHLVLGSRVPPPFAVARLKAQGLALDLPGHSLRFTAAETAQLLTGIAGPAGGEVAGEVHKVTAGWPAAVRLLGECLAESAPGEWSALVRGAGGPGGALEGYLVEEVVPATTEAVIDLVRAVVALDRFTAPLAAELAGPGGDELVSTLVRDGLWLVPDDRGNGSLVVPPVLRYFVRSRWAVGAEHDAVVGRRAAAWREGRGEAAGALTQMLTAGPVADAGAMLVRGDYDGAIDLLRPALAGDGPLAMATGLVAGLSLHFRGELDEARSIYSRALVTPGDVCLRALVLGWAAAAAWLTGDSDACRRLTEEVEETAARCGDDRALAMACNARAMVAALDGDATAMRHYGRALAHAEAAHDHFQIVRIRTNRGSRFLAEASYREALAELDEAVRLADLAGIGVFRGLALVNRGQALIGLGRLDEAARELEAAKADYEGRGSRNAGYPSAYLGTVYRLQGHATLAAANYEEAIAAAEASGDHQAMVPALAGLALVVAETDVAEAARMAERAVGLTSLARPDALIAAAVTANLAGARADAVARADDAILAARTRRDRAAFATALAVKGDIVGDAALLQEAATLWAAIGNPLAGARVRLAQARLGGPDAAAAAAEAEQELRRLGARGLAVEAARLRADLESAARPALAVGVLGRFVVERAGVPVPGTQWQSRKARDLLKILVSRRGRPVAREVLLDLLWPDEDPAKSASRLSVTLSTLRSVLDPEKRFDGEHFVAQDRAAAWLRLEHVAVDAERFLNDAKAGLAALARGDREGAGPLLASAEAAYGGEFLEEDPYEEWPVMVREQARAVYVSVTMALADLALAGGDHDGAAAYLLRVLGQDAYDERAHLQLVAALSTAGRHGEARRMYRAYCTRMAEIDVEPSAFPHGKAT